MVETQRLWFRKYTIDDLEFLLKMTSNKEIMKYIGTGITWNANETKERLNRFMSWYDSVDDIGLMVAVNKNSGEPVGHAGLVPQTIEGKQEIEIGYWIDQEYWGQGFATEAAMAWKEYGFNKLYKKRLVSIIQLGNIPSIQVAQKNGMTFEREVDFNSKNVGLYSISRSIL
ncbi:GNAT family N-acetyltransferase [Paenibacillus sp. MER 180]|uniref:GNAT family N-acetyltransferase n=1 Tax=Paenibacillus sp. MER 180 TaxID=2939570 RepID=UPI00203ED589|nr:GNAT family N-acetyltransferase [Paenibacillus sp. MER 180]MCM3293083.1 GNAT family N-acetyltransferase [Paenibacillus sp. MER 180]